MFSFKIELKRKIAHLTFFASDYKRSTKGHVLNWIKEALFITNKVSLLSVYVIMCTDFGFAADHNQRAFEGRTSVLFCNCRTKQWRLQVGKDCVRCPFFNKMSISRQSIKDSSATLNQSFAWVYSEFHHWKTTLPFIQNSPNVRHSGWQNFWNREAWKC